MSGRGVEQRRRPVPAGEVHNSHDATTSAAPAGGSSGAERTRLVRPDGNGGTTGGSGVDRDLPSQKEANQRLQESEERFRRIAEQSPDIIYRVGQNALEYMSPACFQILGFRPEDRVGQANAMPSNIHPDDLPKLGEINARLSEGPVRCELKMLHEDGHTVWTEHHLRPILSESGEKTAVEGIVRDITDRKRAEEYGRRQQKELQVILDSVPAMIWYKDRENRILRANRVAAETIGRSPSDLERQSTYDLYPDEATQYHKDDLEVIESGTPKLGIVERVEDPSGEKRWVCTDKRPYRNERGEIIGVIVFSVDITDRKRAEEDLLRAHDDLERRVRERTIELADAVETLRAEIAERKKAEEARRQSEEQLRVIAEGVPAFFALIGADQRYRFINRHYEEAGISRADTVGKHAREVIGATTYAWMQPHIEAALSGKSVNVEMDVPLRSGETRWTTVNLVPHFVGDGRVDGFFALASDTTERKRIEQRLDLALWATDLGIWDWNVRTGEVVYDERWTAILGYTQEEIAPKLEAWHSLVHPDDRLRVVQSLNDHVREPQGEHYEVEHRLRAKDGTYKWVLTRAKAVHRNRRGKALRFTGTSRDITARKLIEEKARIQQSELAHVLRLHTIDGMAAQLAHEINQPLGAIANFAHGLAARLRNQTAEPDSMLETAEQIGAQAIRAGQVLRRLRYFTRKDPPTKRPHDLNRLAREAAHLIEPDARHHEITLHLALHPDLPLVEVDEIQIEQVILNLLRNGLEAIADAGRQETGTNAPSHELNIETGVCPNGDVEVKVRDTGIGIQSATAGELFEPFFTTKKEGLGMGLAISRSIVEAHDGRLSVEANPDRGITFRFSLPGAASNPLKTIEVSSPPQDGATRDQD